MYLRFACEVTACAELVALFPQLAEGRSWGMGGGAGC